MLKVKDKYSMTYSVVFIVDFDHSQHINILFLFLTLNKYFSVPFERQAVMFWKHKERLICFVIKVARPISFSDLSMHRIEINYEQMTILWTYYEHSMNMCFSSKFALGIIKVLSSFRAVFWSALLLLFPRELILFCCNKLWKKLVAI